MGMIMVAAGAAAMGTDMTVVIGGDTYDYSYIYGYIYNCGYGYISGYTAIVAAGTGMATDMSVTT